MGYKVKAKERGYYGYIIREAGEKFEIASPSDFSHNWMSPVGWNPPARRQAAVTAEVAEAEPEALSFKGAKEAYGEDGIEITLEEAINKAIDDADLGLEQWNKLPEGERKKKIIAAIKALIAEEKENRRDDDDSDDEEMDETEE